MVRCPSSVTKLVACESAKKKIVTINNDEIDKGCDMTLSSGLNLQKHIHSFSNL